MLPVKSWRITYEDGSTFTNLDGTWAEAPPFGVQCVVYFHVSDPDKLQTVTVDGGEDLGDVYVWLGEETHPDYAGRKMGLYMDRDGYYRIYHLARSSSAPEV